MAGPAQLSDGACDLNDHSVPVLPTPTFERPVLCAPPPRQPRPPIAPLPHPHPHLVLPPAPPRPVHPTSSGPPLPSSTAHSSAAASTDGEDGRRGGVRGENRQGDLQQRLDDLASRRTERDGARDEAVREKRNILEELGEVLAGIKAQQAMNDENRRVNDADHEALVEFARGLDRDGDVFEQYVDKQVAEFAKQTAKFDHYVDYTLTDLERKKGEQAARTEDERAKLEGERAKLEGERARMVEENRVDVAERDPDFAERALERLAFGFESWRRDKVERELKASLAATKAELERTRLAHAAELERIRLEHAIAPKEACHEVERDQEARNGDEDGEGGDDHANGGKGDAEGSVHEVERAGPAVATVERAPDGDGKGELDKQRSGASGVLLEPASPPGESVGPRRSTRVSRQPQRFGEDREEEACSRA
ncbi:hypothetical protein JCM3775_000444 [Rhodotorula graminis]